MVSEITYMRDVAGFKQPFTIKQNGTALDLTTLTSPTVRWHFKDSAEAKTSLNWDGTPTGPSNEVANILVTTGFFSKEDDYITSIEVFDSGILILQSIENILVHILEPAGVHTD